MTTLFDAMVDLANNAGVTIGGRTTAVGSQLYLTDTKRYEQDNYYKNGTVFFTSGDNAGQSRRVISYEQVSGKIEFAPQVDLPVLDEVHYTITNVSKEILIQSINNALMQMGSHIEIDDSVVIRRNTREYKLPPGVRGVKRVEINFTDAKGDYRLYNWYAKNGRLIITGNLYQSDDRTLRIYYNAYHPTLFEDEDEVLDVYNRERLAWKATELFLLNRMQYSGNADERENFLLQNAIEKSNKLALTYPVSRMPRDPHLA